MTKLTLLGEEVTRCVACGSKTFKVKLYIYSVPFFDNIMIEVGKCDTCGFRKTDVSVAEFGTPKRVIARIKEPRNLNALVVKSSTATLTIPELGVEVTPGPAAPGYVTTVEGVLHRVLEVIPAECLNPNSKCHEKVELIQKAIEGKVKFTLIIEDPLGRSGVRGGDIEVAEEPLDKRKDVI